MGYNSDIEPPEPMNPGLWRRPTQQTGKVGSMHEIGILGY